MGTSHLVPAMTAVFIRSQPRGEGDQMVLTLYTRSTEPSQHEQAYFPAQQPPSREGSRLPRSHAHARRSCHRHGPSRQGPRQAHRVVDRAPMPARRHRITRGDDYRHVVRNGNRVGGAYCITHAVLHVHEDRPARFGFIVSKAVGGSVTRNLVRRRLKAIVERRLAEGFSGADVVFRALPASAEAPFAELEREVTRSLTRLHRMPRGAERV